MKKVKLSLPKHTCVIGNLLQPSSGVSPSTPETSGDNALETDDSDEHSDEDDFFEDDQPLILLSNSGEIVDIKDDKEEATTVQGKQYHHQQIKGNSALFRIFFLFNDGLSCK